MVETIQANGWRQGSIFPTSANDSLAAHAPCTLNSDVCCIVVSQSCDILCPDVEAEPYVEVVLAHRLDGDLDGAYTHAKNPRCLHFPIDWNDLPVAYKTHSRHRFNVPKALLAEYAPDPTRGLSENSLFEVVRWIVGRYDREAFPDEFNNRITPKVLKKLRKILREMEKLSGLYIALNSWDELTSESPYQIYLYGTARTENFDDPNVRAQLEQGLARIATAIRTCDGMEVIDHQVRSEAKVTLDEVRMLKRWPLDYISLSDQDNHDMPAVG